MPGGQPGGCVFVDVLKSDEPESSVPLVSCVRGHASRVRLRDQAIRVLELRRFTTNERVFAYRVTAQLMRIENSEMTPIASEMMLTFYDEDGTGRFTLMQYPGPELIPKLDVPEWARGNK